MVGHEDFIGLQQNDWLKKALFFEAAKHTLSQRRRRANRTPGRLFLRAVKPVSLISSIHPYELDQEDPGSVASHDQNAWDPVSPHHNHKARVSSSWSLRHVRGKVEWRCPTRWCPSSSFQAWSHLAFPWTFKSSKWPKSLKETFQT